MKQSTPLPPLDYVERWQPPSTYRFQGGPVDGQDFPVLLIPTPTGLVAPPFRSVVAPWQLRYAGTWRPPHERVPQLHRYRFQPTGPSGNRGYYVHVESPSTLDTNV